MKRFIFSAALFCLPLNILLAMEEGLERSPKRQRTDQQTRNLPVYTQKNNNPVQTVLPLKFLAGQALCHKRNLLNCSFKTHDDKTQPIAYQYAFATLFQHEHLSVALNALCLTQKPTEDLRIAIYYLLISIMQRYYLQHNDKISYEFQNEFYEYFEEDLEDNPHSHYNNMKLCKNITKKVLPWAVRHNYSEIYNLILDHYDYLDIEPGENAAQISANVKTNLPESLMAEYAEGYGLRFCYMKSSLVELAILNQNLPLLQKLLTFNPPIVENDKTVAQAIGEPFLTCLNDFLSQSQST